MCVCHAARRSCLCKRWAVFTQERLKPRGEGERARTRFKERGAPGWRVQLDENGNSTAHKTLCVHSMWLRPVRYRNPTS